jgi:hypothetical protein
MRVCISLSRQLGDRGQLHIIAVAEISDADLMNEIYTLLFLVQTLRPRDLIHCEKLLVVVVLLLLLGTTGLNKLSLFLLLLLLRGYSSMPPAHEGPTLL